MENPYRGFGRPVSGDGFIGRKKIVEDISNDLKSGNVFLTGLHRIGKSSVAQEVLNRLAAEGTLVCRIVNLHTVKTEYDLFRLMLTALECPAARALPKDDDFLAFLETQEALENKHRDQSSRSVMVIDEMDGILSFDDPAITISRLRELAYYPDRFGINFMFISSRSPQTIADKGAGSNLPGICQPRFLEPFDSEETVAFIAKCGLLGDEAFVEGVYAQTGGVPYLMAVLMSAICDYAGDCLIAMSHEERMSALEDCVPTVAHSFLEYYGQVRHTLSDDGNTWGELIGTLIGPITKTRDPIITNLFREYGIIDKDGTCHNRHFIDYLEMCSRDIAPFEDLKSVEVCLRKIVNDQLTKKFGNSWADTVCRELPAVAQGLEKARENLRKEMRQFHLAKETDIVEFTDLGDIKTIVSSPLYWPLFQHPIGMGEADFKKCMDRIIPMRNRTMHHRPSYLLPPEQVSMARDACKELLRRIK